jgi:hypothetical protein
MQSTRTVDKDGTIWYKNKNGKLHRTDGPAFEHTSGTKSWWINGVRHREDGPATIYSNGYERYYLNDKKYSKEEYDDQVAKFKLGRILEL